MISGIPDDLVVPAAITRVAGGRDIEAIWANGIGGLTVRFRSGSSWIYAKWNPHGNGIDLEDEITRIEWAGGYTRVPEVLDAGSDDDGRWFLSGGIEGTNPVTERWRADPGTAVAAIGRGLRQLHDSLPVPDCPFSWEAEHRVDATCRLEATPQDVRDALRRIPPVHERVVCHGDACAPNTVLDDTGHVSGHVDLGSLGTGDRWADLAVATWSTEWNYGPGWESHLLEAYGIGADPVRIPYYRLLRDHTLI